MTDDNFLDGALLTGRDALERKINRRTTVNEKSKGLDTPESTPVAKESRNWMNINEKVSKKDMAKIDVSTH